MSQAPQNEGEETFNPMEDESPANDNEVGTQEEAQPANDNAEGAVKDKEVISLMQSIVGQVKEVFTDS